MKENVKMIFETMKITALIISTTQVVCINLVMSDNPRLCSKENSREPGALNL